MKLLKVVKAKARKKEMGNKGDEQIKKIKLKVLNVTILIIALNGNYLKLYRKFRLSSYTGQQTALSQHLKRTQYTMSFKFRNNWAFMFRIY